MSKPKAPWPVTVGMIAVAIVVVALGYAEDRRSEARSAQRAAIEASHGETPKPEDHGR